MTAQPAPRPVPAPADVVVQCPTCDGSGWCEGDKPGQWQLGGVKSPCPTCRLTPGKVTYRVGEVDGVLMGYCYDTGQLGWFSDDDDMRAGVFCTSGPADPCRSVEHAWVFTALGVEL
jgi:hypothetical protein